MFPFKLVKEIKSRAGVLHFRRWRIIDSKWFGIYLHYIAKADEDKHAHNHPWSFVLIILRGGYTEKINMDCYRAAGQVMHTWNEVENTPGTFRYRKKNAFHQIGTLHKPTWSLVIHGPRRDDWGYLTEDGIIDHETYRKRKHNKENK